MLGKQEQPPSIKELRKRIRQRIEIDKTNNKYKNINTWAHNKVLNKLTDEHDIIYII